MYETLAHLVNDLAGQALSGTHVIRWGAPVPAFGDPSRARVATLGLNPSNREFVDEKGNELKGMARRFHTLTSLGIKGWDQADARHLKLVVQSCGSYFHRNPYDRWFRRLDALLKGTGTSYYAAGKARRSEGVACHLDVIPFATHRKWTSLTAQQRLRLLARSGDAFGSLLRDSPIRVLVLNGQSVVNHFEQLANVDLDRYNRNDWALPRQAGGPVQGVAYKGVIRRIGFTELGHDLLVVGYNHNIQSSFGVTQGALRALAKWIRSETVEWLT